MRRGFTLIELLIVLVILAATLALSIPSFNALPSMQITHASRDALSILRYARNMALQTQTPMIVTFAPGSLSVKPEETAGATMTYTVAQLDALYAAGEDSDTKSTASAKTATSAKESAQVLGGTLEDMTLTRRYDKVAFSFEHFDDTVEDAAFVKRSAAQPEPTGETFSVTVRTNGTIRPFTLRVHEKENTERDGTRISFDFLCSGTIHDED